MRLVHLAQYEGPYGGSFIAMVRSVLNEARRRGHDVEAVFSHTAATKPWLADIQADGIPVRFAQGSRGDHTRVIRELLAEHPEQPTVLHTHFTAFDIPAVVAARSHPDTKVFWHLHTPARTTPRYRLQNLIKFGLVGRSVSEIFCVAPHMTERVARMAPAGKTRFFHNAIDVDAFSPATGEQRAAAREVLGMNADGKSLLHFGWHWDLKGGDLFLDTVAELLGRGVAVRAITRSNDPEAPAAIAERGLADVVQVITEVDRVQSLFAASDVLVASSRAEGMPFTAFEALCSGVQVAASDIPGHAAAGKLGGCTLSPRDPAAMADVVEQMLLTPADAASSQTAGARAELETTLSLARWSGDLLAAYARALAQDGGESAP